MQDKDYSKAIKSYSLDTLRDISAHINRETYPHRYEWIQSEIDSRTKGIPAEPVVAVPEFTFHTDDLYAGFWHRFAATSIDTLLVYVPLGFWFKWSLLLPSPYSLLLLLPLPLVFPVYNIICLTVRGQTLGKMALGIQVVVAGDVTVSMQRASARHCVDAVLAVLMLTTLLVGLVVFTSDGNSHSSVVSSFHRQLPAWDLLDDVWDAWIWSELVVLLFNQHKRGPHDYLAGTFVIHKARLQEFLAEAPEGAANWFEEGWHRRLLASLRSFGLTKLRSAVSSAVK
jgi:uncharacterized RDD family membrane protein YckC|tara:strand:+ start:9515 stop:10366 length:852 start_codon:yes stop_codon:yes gene_type:complete